MLGLGAVAHRGDSDRHLFSPEPEAEASVCTVILYAGEGEGRSNSNFGVGAGLIGPMMGWLGYLGLS